MFEIRGIGKYFGAVPAVRNVSFTIKRGEVLGLVGPSGAGKSVLLKLVGKVMRPDFGELSYQGENVRIGFLFQEGALFDSMTVLQNVAFPLLTVKSLHQEIEGQHSRSPDCDYETAMKRSYEILYEVGLAKAGHKLPGQLSGGMRRRVALARALVNNPDLALLDDPTGGLDPVAASVIMNLIAELHAHYKPTILMVSHDLRRLLPSVERVLALFDGTLVCDAPVAELPRRAAPNVMAFLKTRYDFQHGTEDLQRSI